MRLFEILTFFSKIFVFCSGCSSALAQSSMEKNNGGTSSSLGGPPGRGGGGVTNQKTQDTLSVLREEIKKREEAMDRDSKMRKMAQLQLSVTQDSKNRAPILAQIENWEQNLEIMQCDLYR